MTSNSVNMSLEEKLVQHIKKHGLGLLVNDEDALTKLTRKAIDQALYQKRRDKEGWNSHEIDSPVVEAAREIAKASLTKLMQQQIELMLADPKVLETLRIAITTAIPLVMMEASQNLYRGVSENSSMQVIQKLRESGVLQ